MATVYAIVYDDPDKGIHDELHKIKADEAQAKRFVEYANQCKSMYINGTFRVAPFIVE